MKWWDYSVNPPSHFCIEVHTQVACSMRLVGRHPRNALVVLGIKVLTTTSLIREVECRPTRFPGTVGKPIETSSSGQQSEGH